MCQDMYTLVKLLCRYNNLLVDGLMEINLSLNTKVESSEDCTILLSVHSILKTLHHDTLLTMQLCNVLGWSHEATSIRLS